MHLRGLKIPTRNTRVCDPAPGGTQSCLGLANWTLTRFETKRASKSAFQMERATGAIADATNRHLQNLESQMETRTSGQREDRFTGALESQTSRAPSSLFLGLAIGSMA